MAHLHISDERTPQLAVRHGNRLYQRIGKRLLDMVLVLALLPMSVLLICVLGLLVRRDGQNALFAHTRVGRGGRTFRCWKLRTMVPDADARLAHLLHSNETYAKEWAATQKLSDDPRITSLGRFLRRTSLDELPQLWNVLVGDMSFVGPRPVTPEELSRYGAQASAYLSLKPGITGIWQLDGRQNGCYTERLRMDLSYVQTMSLGLDLRLIARTSQVVFYPTGR